MKKIAIGSEKESELTIINSGGNQYQDSIQSFVLPFIGKHESGVMYFKNQTSGFWEIIPDEVYQDLERNVSFFFELNDDLAKEAKKGIRQSTKNTITNRISAVIKEIERLEKKLLHKK